jgi:hypothetical protein
MVLAQLIYRIVADPQFCAALQDDPAAAYAAYDLRLSAEEWSALLDALRAYTRECLHDAAGAWSDRIPTAIWDGGPAITPAALVR